MPFNENTAAGTVVYTPGAFWSGNVLANDSELVSSTDYASILSVTLGKYERIVFNMWIDTANDADGDLKWKLLTPSSPTSFRARMVLPEVPISGAVTEAVTSEITGTGIAEQTAVGTDSAYYIKVNGVLINGANTGSLDFQAAQNTSSATATTIKAGSYIEYMKF
tara:strand:- start:352 stop:846 length:495 start_codon:yes stop_codon:yes gene_type:complete